MHAANTDNNRVAAMGSDEWAPEQISLGNRAKGRPALERQGGSRTDMFEVSSDNFECVKGKAKLIFVCLEVLSFDVGATLRIHTYDPLVSERRRLRLNQRGIEPC